MLGGSSSWGKGIWVGRRCCCPPWAALSRVSAPRLAQVIQLLACDLLLSLRTSLWQKQASSSQALGETYHASASELTGFQRDLGSLRKLAHGFRPAYRKVRLRPSPLLSARGVQHHPAAHRLPLSSRSSSTRPPCA